MAISDAAKEYVEHMVKDHGVDVSELARRWKKTYPDDAFTVAEASKVAGVKTVKKAKKPKKGG
jgi:hypothetical protein